MRIVVATLLTLGVSLSAATCGVSAFEPGVQESPAKVKPQASVWMKTKVKYAEEILVGLTEGDFKRVEKNARALNFASSWRFFSLAKTRNTNGKLRCLREPTRS